MGTPSGRTWRDPSGLAERLAADGERFDFFQAVWLLERFGDPGTLVGERGPVADERLSFRPDVSMAFPPTEVKRILQRVMPDGGIAYAIDETFLGLYGVTSPLPTHYAVDVIRAVESAGTSVTGRADAEVGSEVGPDAALDGRAPVRDFIDIFNHRLVSLFYRSWLKYRFERTFQLDGRDSITDYLRLLIGCAPEHDRDVLGVDPLRLIRYAGVLTQRPRSATTLEGVLEDYWPGLGCGAQQCVGRWVVIEESDQNRLGVRRTTLGEDLTLGSQVYDLCGCVVLALGPMDWDTYLAFLPTESGFQKTRRLTMLYTVDPLDVAFELLLMEHEVPAMCIDSSDESARLGYTSWVHTDDIAETSVVFDAA